MTAAEARNTSDRRKPYVKPLLERVALKPEEAILGACKIIGLGGKPTGICGPTCPTAGS
jgi:hypothetical protein